MYYSDLKTAIFKKLQDNATQLGLSTGQIVFGAEVVPAPSLHIMMYPADSAIGKTPTGLLNCNIEIGVEANGNYSNEAAMDEVVDLCQKTKDLVKQVGSVAFSEIFPIVEDQKNDTAKFVLVFKGFVEF